MLLTANDPQICEMIALQNAVEINQSINA